MVSGVLGTLKVPIAGLQPFPEQEKQNWSWAHINMKYRAWVFYCNNRYSLLWSAIIKLSFLFGGNIGNETNKIK